MTTYGVTPEGFVRKPQEVILAEINQEQQARISPDWDVSAESPMGQVNGIMSRHFSLLWELAETALNAIDPDKAEDALLTMLGKLTGKEREAADYSYVNVSFGLTEGTPLLAGVHFIEDEDDTTSRWTLVEDFTSPADGTYTKRFRSENKGPIDAGGGKLTVISTPVNGWTSPSNEFDATVGRLVEEDPEFRIDREAQIANAAGATLDGCSAAVGRVSGVLTVLPFENVGHYPDSNGLPPHCFEMVLWDGEDEDASNNAIAQAIWDHKPSGMRSFGTESGVATDANGDEHVIWFSRATQVPVYLTFVIDGEDDFDEDDFKLGVATDADAVFTGGKSVLYTRIISIAWAQDNLDNVVSATLGDSPAPVATADIPITRRQIARFDTARITVTAP